MERRQKMFSLMQVKLHFLPNKCYFSRKLKFSGKILSIVSRPDEVAWLALSKLSANLAACSAARREAVLETGRTGGGKPGTWLVVGEGPSLPSLPS